MSVGQPDRTTTIVKEWLEQPAPAGDRPSQNGWAYDEWMPSSHERRFDIRGQHLSLSEMGIFPATLLSRSERVRGNHPINSFAGVGPRASEIIDMQAPHRVYGPFEKLCEEGRHAGAGHARERAHGIFGRQPRASGGRRVVLGGHAVGVGDDDDNDAGGDDAVVDDQDRAATARAS